MSSRPKYLSDKPEGIDKFNGGSQNSLAKAIVQHIVQNDSLEKGALPRIIGIEGTWGSGKSNVVKMVKKELDSQVPQGYHFFEYDAWGNQEDLQRRSLLEQLTSDLISSKILGGTTTIKIKGGQTKSVSWDEKLKMLLARKTETSSESYPRISNGMIAGALTTIGTSISSLVALLCADNCGWWSLIIAFFPILTTLAVWGCAVRKNKNYKNLSYLLAIYNDKVKNETEFEVISEDEPSVVEFKGWMNDVSENLNADLCKKLIIVFDNMDRLPSEKVKQLWSSIHTFFAETGFQNVWAIIPFDETHLSCAFGEEKGKVELTRYFINKTFPVIFSVPKPVITDYRGIFTTLFKEAFGDNVPEEDIINRIYRLNKPTPNIRDIIIFLNNMVSLCCIRNNDIQLKTMSIYLLHKDAILDDPVTAILSGNYLGIEKNIIDNDDDFKSEIAALTYGIGKDNARQIPLTEYISKCIDDPESNDINAYSENNNDFDIILKEVITSSDHAKTELIVKCLNKLTRSNEVIANLWQEIVIRLLKLEIKKQVLPEEYEIALSHVSDKDCQRLVNKLCKSWIDCSDFSGSNYVKCIKSLESIQSPKFTIPRHKKNVSADVFIDALLTATDSYKNYKLQTDPDKLDEYLASKLPNDFRYAQCVAILVKDEFSDFKKLKEKIEDLISNDAIDGKSVGQICIAYRSISGENVVSKQISENNLSAILPDLANNQKTSIEDGFIDLLAISLVKNRSIISPEDKYIPEVAQIIDSYADYGDLIIKNLSWNNSYLNKVLKHMITNNLGNNADIEELVKNYEGIKSRYGISDEILLEHLDRWDSSDLDNADYSEHQNFQTLIPSSAIIRATSSVNNELTNRINKLAVESISKCSKEDFINTENSYSSNFWHQILDTLIEHESMEDKPQCVIDYAAHLWLQLAIGQRAIQKDDHFYKIATAVDSSKISHVFSDIRDKFCNNQATIDANRFCFVEQNLREHGSLIERATDVVNRIIKPVIGNQPVKEIILSNGSFYKTLFEKADNINDFKNSVKNAWSSDNDFMALLGISIDKES